MDALNDVVKNLSWEPQNITIKERVLQELELCILVDFCMAMD